MIFRIVLVSIFGGCFFLKSPCLGGQKFVTSQGERLIAFEDLVVFMSCPIITDVFLSPQKLRFFFAGDFWNRKKQQLWPFREKRKKWCWGFFPGVSGPLFLWSYLCNGRKCWISLSERIKHTTWENWHVPKKGTISKGNFITQPLFFRGHVGFPGC